MRFPSDQFPRQIGCSLCPNCSWYFTWNTLFFLQPSHFLLFWCCSPPSCRSPFLPPALKLWIGRLVASQSSQHCLRQQSVHLTLLEQRETSCWWVLLFFLPYSLSIILNWNVWSRSAFPRETTLFLRGSLSVLFFSFPLRDDTVTLVCVSFCVSCKYLCCGRCEPICFPLRGTQKQLRNVNISSGFLLKIIKNLTFEEMKEGFSVTGNCLWLDSAKIKTCPRKIFSSHFPLHVETYLPLECIVCFRGGHRCIFVPECVAFWGKHSRMLCLSDGPLSWVWFHLPIVRTNLRKDNCSSSS